MFGAFALAGGLALVAGACGSSSSSSSNNKPSSSAPVKSNGPADNVTAIPAISATGGGATTLTLDPATAKALTGLGVKVAPAGKATANAAGNAVTFPMTSGYAEIHSNKAYPPGYILGSIQHSGGLSFSAGGKTLEVTNFTVDPGNSMLYASVNNSTTDPQIPLAFLDGTNLKVSMANGDVVLDGTKVELTSTAAKALDTEFGTQALKPGVVVGTAHLVIPTTGATTYNESSDKTTDVTRLTGDNTGVTLDPATATALTKTLGLKLGTVGKATFDTAASELHFPITGGVAIVHSDKSAKPGYIDGVLLHQDSGFSLSKGATTVSITNLTIDPGNSKLYATVNGMQNVFIANLDGSPLQVSDVGQTVHLDGTKIELTPGAATALNQAFGTTAIKPGTLLGTAHIVVNTTAAPMGSINQ